MNAATWICAVEREVRWLADEFRRVPGLLLTEADLKCQLFARLTAIPELVEASESADPGILAAAVHTEISWFDEQGRLSVRPDLTIIDPRNLSIKRSLRKAISFPSKGCHFTGEAIVLELKFYPDRGGIPSRAAAAIQKDIDKIKRLILKSHDAYTPFTMHGFVIVFARYAPQAPEVQQLIQAHCSPEIRLIVEPAGLGGQVLGAHAT